jgi:hypothetical protein
MSMKEWSRKLEAFLQRITKQDGEAKSTIRPALKAAAVADLAKSIDPIAMPRAYRRFLEEASGGIGLEYHWRPAGAEDSFSGCACLCVADELAKELQSCKAWATETWIAESEEDQELWLHGLPFAALPDGDYLALDLRPGVDDPPVLYLSHDDASSQIAPSFTAFLSAWKRLGYIGPEFWVLEPYLDEQGHLSAEGEQAEELRRHLGLVN